MPQHSLFLTIPAKTLLHKDAVLDVFSDEEKLGTLKISQGSIAWRPRKHKADIDMTWEAFDKMLRDRVGG